ncbi:MAG: ribulose-phosphate 3-epimerase [Anaerolineaceae bacterium]|jgi:ribulose-phosphate 3-epimerase|nr:MAG: ribulose-phosphate 3-epimerase [Anaerolineaceae bacterium]
MKNGIALGASLMCADYLNLERDIRLLEQSGVDYLHFDVMDGHFVPNFGLNLDLLKTARRITNLPINVHLMIDNAADYIDAYIDAGCNSLSFHQEPTYHIQRLLQKIKDRGVQAGIALNPATPLSTLEYILSDLDFVLIMTVNPGFAGQALVPATLEKISKLRRMILENKLDIKIQVDGNVSFENIPKMVEAGATMLVGGTSSLFLKKLTISKATQKIYDLLP